MPTISFLKKFFSVVLFLFFAATMMARVAIAQERNANDDDEVDSSEPVSPYTEFAVRSQGPGLFFPWRIGVSAAVGIPHLVTYGLEVMYFRNFSGLISIGDFDVKSESVQMTFSNWDIRGRWHFWGTATFVGLAYGSQSLDGKISTDIDVEGTTVPTTLTLGVDTTYVTPHGGFHWVWNSGLVLGVEGGLQIPIDNDTESIQTQFAVAENAADTSEYGDMREKLKDVVRGMSRANLPHIALRFGWLL